MPTIPRPHAKQLEVMQSPERYKVLSWGRRTGKSVLAGLVVFTEAMKHQGNYYIVAPTERQAKSIYWNDILQVVIPKDILKLCRVNNVEKTITFPHITGDIVLPDGTKIAVDHNEDLPPSTISLRGVDNPDALRGVKLRGAVLDEYAFMDNAKYVFDTILSPALLDYKGWAIFISSPNGVRNPFYDLVKLAQKEGNDYFYSHATALDNPNVPADEFYRIKQRYIDEGKLEAFEQEYEADFKTSNRLVYKNFNSERHYTEGGHMFNPEEIPQDGTYCIGIDFGWVHPQVWAFFLIDYDGNWWLYDEIYKTELTPTRAAGIYRDKANGKHFSKIIGDAQGKTEIANLKEEHIYVFPSSKGGGSINGGIAEVAALLEFRDVVENGKVVPRPRMRFSRACPNIVKDFETYMNQIDAFGEPLDKPADENDHGPDAVRYIVTEYVRANKPRVRKERRYDPVTGKPIS